MTPTLRLLALVAGVTALAVLGLSLPLRDLPDAVSSAGPVAPVVGVAVGAALLVALVPRTPVSLACGLLFGAGLGAACALAVALTAAVATFAAGRWLGRDFVARRAGRRWNRVEAWIAREGVLAVAAVRAMPLGPYGLTGYAYGASGVRTRDYALGTLISASPSAVTYALVGAAVARPGDVDLVMAVPLAFGLVLSATLLIRARRTARSQAAQRAGVVRMRAKP